MCEFGFDFITVEPISDESSDHIDPKIRAIKNAETKVKSISLRFPNSVIIGADTIVYLDGKYLGKPKDPEEAKQMLEELSNKTHHVFTGITVLDTSTSKMISEVAETAVVFKKLCQEEINEYVKTDEPLDKAGAYAIQGEGMNFIIEITGSYSNVVGLPLELLREILRNLAH